MINVLEQYIDPNYVYRFTHGPQLVDSRTAALQRGINCISLAHLALRDLFAYRLPADLLCCELYNDREHFRSVESHTNMQMGDLVWFGLANPKIEVSEFVPEYQHGELLNWPDFPVKHVAIYTGEHDAQGDHLLLHSTATEGTNAVWTLGQFAAYERYQKIYGITRLKVADGLTR
jgi:hypothetical protein